MPRKKAKTDGKKYEYKIIEEFSREEPDAKGQGSVLCVASWIIDGRETAPKFERRSFWNSQDGSFKGGKCQGLTPSDISILFDNIEKVAPAMGFHSQTLIDKFIEKFGKHKTSDEPF